MKRIISILLVAVLLLSFANAEEEYSEAYYEIYGKMKELTDKELQLIKLYADAILFERSESNRPQETTAPNDTGKWATKYFVDSFKEPTNEKYIAPSNRITGTFSNSAATDRKLTVSLLIYMDYSREYKKNIPVIGFDLYEYGNNLVKNGGLKEADYTIYVRTEDGETKWTDAEYYKNSSRMRLKNDGSNEVFLNLIKQNKMLKIRMVEESKYSHSTYLFTIDDTSDFENALNWLLTEEE